MNVSPASSPPTVIYPLDYAPSNKRLQFPQIDELVAVLPQPMEPHVPQILQAHDFAQEELAGEVRDSQELRIEHVRAVGYSVGEVGVNHLAVQSALLHGLVDEGNRPTDLGRIARYFGAGVADILTKLKDVIPPLDTKDFLYTPQKVEAMRRAILREHSIEAVFVRLADRIRNLETAHRLPPDRADKIVLQAQEARQLYAPIANRLGVWKYKSLLEDWAFFYLEPETYHDIAHFVYQHEENTHKVLLEHMAVLQGELAEAGITAEVTGRSKHLYSIYRKMKRKNLPVEEIFDVNALRIILPSNEMRHCYEALGIVHHLWKPIPEEFDDYIAKPKPNGYRSLHTAVYDQHGHTLEVQIRTQAMHDDAERGLGAHWIYKEEGAPPSHEMIRRVEFMRQLMIDLRDRAGQNASADERMVNTDDLSKRIYVLTPNGDIKELAQGSTPIDFAYQVHTELGHRCRGAIVNGNPVPLNYELQEGQTIKIIKGNEARPSRDWMVEEMGYAKSKNARSKVRQWFRLHDRENNVLHGRQMLERELRLVRPKNSISMEEVAREFKEDVDDLLAKIGFGDIQLSQIIGTLTRLKEEKRRKLEQEQVAEEAKIEQEVAAIVTAAPLKPQKGLLIQGLQGLHHSFANCCKPIPPEPIMGYITRGRGVTIHSKACEQFRTQALKEPDRILEVSWGETSPNATYEIPLVVRAIRMPDLADSVATLISGRRIRMVRTKSVTDKRGVTTMYLVVAVTALDELNWLKHKLENMPHVIEVQRQK